MSEEANRCSVVVKVLADGKLKKRFAELLQTKLCAENLQFWDDVEEYKKKPQQATAERIFELYFYGGPREVNVDAEEANTLRDDIRKKVRVVFGRFLRVEALTRSHGLLLQNFHPKLFNEAQKFVFELMEQSIFPQFKTLIEHEVKETTKEESKAKIKKKTSISLENVVIMGPYEFEFFFYCLTLTVSDLSSCTLLFILICNSFAPISLPLLSLIDKQTKTTIERHVGSGGFRLVLHIEVLQPNIYT